MASQDRGSESTHPTDADLLNSLQTLADKLGRTPRMQEVKEQTQYHPTEYKQRFGDWNSVLEAANLKENPVTKQELLEHFTEFAASLGRPPTTTEMNEDGEYSTGLYYQHYESWGDVIEDAGFNKDHYNEAKSTASNRERVPDEDLLNHIHEVALEVGHPPTTTEMNEYGDYSHTLYSQRFDGWRTAVKEAGLTPVFIGEEIPESILREEFERLWELNMQTPTEDDIEQHSRFSLTTFKAKYGQWENVVDELSI